MRCIKNQKQKTKKKREREKLKTKLTFFFDLDSVQDEGGRLQTKEITSQSLRIDKVIKIVDRLCVFSGRLDALFISTLEPRVLLNYKCTIKGQ